MKRFLILILIFAGLAFYFTTRESAPVQNPSQPETQAFKPDPSNATFTFDGEAVTLSNGKSSGTVDNARVLEEQASGDLNKDGKEDSVLLMARSGGGSGVFIYIAAYVSGPVSYKGTDALFVGDRVSPLSVSIESGVVTLRYLDRKLEEPFSAEPTIQVTKQYVYQNGLFVEK